MDNIPSETEVEIIEQAIAVITQLTADREALKQQLIPLSNDNEALREVIRKSEADEVKSDEAIGRLRAALPQPATDPETDPGEGDGDGTDETVETPPLSDPQEEETPPQ